jgi:hypothetical protein
MPVYEIFIILLQVYSDMADSVYQMLGIRYLSVPDSGRADHSATDTLLLMPLDSVHGLSERLDAGTGERLLQKTVRLPPSKGCRSHPRRLMQRAESLWLGL